jgi:hypothetical protein
MNRSQFRERIEAFKANPDETNVLPAVLAFLKEEWANFDATALPEANRILDGLLRVGAENARKALPTLEDGTQRRETRRLLAYTEGDHQSALDAVKVLERETKQEHPVVSRASAAFIPALQCCLDFLYDARQEEPQSRVDIVLIGLLLGMVDELLAGFHLAQRGFTAQAFAHARTVEEVTAVAEVFLADRALFDEWLGVKNAEEEKRVFWKLNNAVKKKLGTEGTDKLYAFLSAVGTHAQFRRLQVRIDETTAVGRTATFTFIGSTSRIEAANVLVVRAAVALAQTLARVFFSRLNANDVQVQLTKCTSGLAQLTKDYLLPIAEQTKIEPTELGRILEGAVTSTAEAPAPAASRDGSSNTQSPMGGQRACALVTRFRKTRKR